MAYNGWSNYETWNVHLWLTNDEGSYEMARDAVRHARPNREDEAIRDLVREMAPDLGASMFSDLLTAALDSVNWQEVADAFKDEDEDAEVSTA